MRYQFLIPTVPHRHEKLCRLLKVLDEQLVPEVGVLLYRDNLRISYREKLQALSDAATGDYVSVIQDDDSISPDYLERVLSALESNPDQIGFRVLHTTNGQPTATDVYHSLQHWPGVNFTGNIHYRDHQYFNPMRRDLFQAVKFRGYTCDDEWTEDQRAAGRVKTEVFIDEQIFHYTFNSGDHWHTLRGRGPLPTDIIPPLPEYPWLNVLLDEE
jgi:hypothetical protein